MSQIKQIDIIDKSSKQRLKLIQNLKQDILLIDEEQTYLILINEKIVIQDINGGYEGPKFYKVTLQDLIDDIKEDMENME